MKNLIPGGVARTILDVGANTGQSAVHFAEAFPDATIFSFEPFPEAFQGLTLHAKKYSRIHSIQTALGEKCGVAEFHYNRNNVTNSLLPTVPEARDWVDGAASEIDYLGAIRVPVTTIDQFCRDQGIRHVDILKMDIQGGEYLALKGASEMLQRGAFSVLYLEVCLVPLYENQAKLHELAGVLDQYGYYLFNFMGCVWDKSSRLKWCDLVFASQRCMQESFRRAA
jgi:FkbM family methyltransferase